ncbi:hypothetical protein ACLOJK_032547 [Asimina triloba]
MKALELQVMTVKTLNSRGQLLMEAAYFTIILSKLLPALGLIAQNAMIDSTEHVEHDWHPNYWPLEVLRKFVCFSIGREALMGEQLGNGKLSSSIHLHADSERCCLNWLQIACYHHGCRRKATLGCQRAFLSCSSLIHLLKHALNPSSTSALRPEIGMLAQSFDSIVLGP